MDLLQQTTSMFRKVLLSLSCLRRSRPGPQLQLPRHPIQTTSNSLRRQTAQPIRVPLLRWLASSSRNPSRPRREPPSPPLQQFLHPRGSAGYNLHQRSLTKRYHHHVFRKDHLQRPSPLRPHEHILPPRALPNRPQSDRQPIPTLLSIRTTLATTDHLLRPYLVLGTICTTSTNT